MKCASVFEVVLLQRIVRLARDQGLAVGRLEPRALHLPVADLAIERVYTPTEVTAILAADVDPQPRAFFATLLLSGMRASEVLGLRWADLDFDARTIHVRRSAVAGRLGAITKDPARFTAEGRADSEPAVPENPRDARNRRVEITLLRPGSQPTRDAGGPKL